jgi:hypothetical protein
MIIKHPIKIIVIFAISYSSILFYFEYEKQLAIKLKENYFPLLEACYQSPDTVQKQRITEEYIPCKT